jgi:SAM-dependent methyltransferase
VTGVDISSGMLDVARSRQSGVRYSETMPTEKFGWVNSYIVIQHIPPARGNVLIRELLDAVEPGGFASIHVTFWRDDHLIARPPRRGRKFWVRPRHFLPEGSMTMHDYDLTVVMRTFVEAGFASCKLVHQNHGGHHGFIILGAKNRSIATENG